MRSINYLTGSDIIQPDDLFREVIFQQHDWGPSVDNTNTCTYWTRVKFCREFWIGKKVSEYRKQCDMNVSFIRTKATTKQLEEIGIYVYMPDAPHRHWCRTNNGVLGNRKDYPRDFTFNFGKFKGEKLSEVFHCGVEHRNKEYLEWAYKEVKCMPEAHRKILGEWLESV
jgi:hypothetical protein